MRLNAPSAARGLARAAAAAAVAVVAVACGPASEAEPNQEQEATAVAADLDSIYGVFTEAYRNADVERLMREVYATDGYYLPPGGPILEGQEQFRRNFEFLDRYEAGAGPRISFEILDRDVSGDLAYDIGYYTLRSPDDAGEAGGDRGKFIVIWKRDARGSWRIHADGYNGANVARPPADTADDAG